MTTIISLSRDISELSDYIQNYDEFAQHADLSECTDFRFHFNQELLIYNGRTTVYACSTQKYKNGTYVTYAYNRNSELVYQYSIDYDL